MLSYSRYVIVSVNQHRLFFCAGVTTLLRALRHLGVAMFWQPACILSTWQSKKYEQEFLSRVLQQILLTSQTHMHDLRNAPRESLLKHFRRSLMMVKSVANTR